MADWLGSERAAVALRQREADVEPVVLWLAEAAADRLYRLVAGVAEPEKLSEVVLLEHEVGVGTGDGEAPPKTVLRETGAAAA